MKNVIRFIIIIMSGFHRRYIVLKSTNNTKISRAGRSATWVRYSATPLLADYLNGSVVAKALPMEEKSCGVAVADKNFLRALPLPTAVQKDSYFYGKEKDKFFYEAIGVKA